MLKSTVDQVLLDQFRAEVKGRTPHHAGEDGFVNATPLDDITSALLECAREQGLNLSKDGVRVYAKFDSKIHGGSVKVRPAVAILEDAISTGRLKRGQVVFEATSGNFGLALGMLSRLGVEVVALVSRKLQKGVVEKLLSDGVKIIHLDIDICPAPGMMGDVDLVVAKGVAQGVRQQLTEIGLDPAPFDSVRHEAEAALARQDAMGLAKLLAGAYGGFCPEQYDNALNVEAHRSVTGPEVDHQLRANGSSLGEFAVVCAFGTGGTATGVSEFVRARYGRSGVRVVFPLTGQDVAGIRTKDKALGLKFYSPESYLGEHEVDFEETRKVFDFFNTRGYDVGESGALVLYACIQLLNYGLERRLVAVVADGSSKYGAGAATLVKDQVSLKEAAAKVGEYGAVLWAHNMFVPREEGVRVIAKSLGCPEETVKVARSKDVQAILNGGEPSEEFGRLLPSDGRVVLVVCMAGNTSLMLAKVLEKKGVVAQSLMGGITALPASRGRQPFELVQISRA